MKKYGKWVGEPVYVGSIGGSGEKYQQCSNCLRYRNVDNFCSNCGAKMIQNDEQRMEKEE